MVFYIFVVMNCKLFVSKTDIVKFAAVREVTIVKCVPCGHAIKKDFITN